MHSRFEIQFHEAFFLVDFEGKKFRNRKKIKTLKMKMKLPIELELKQFPMLQEKFQQHHHRN